MDGPRQHKEDKGKGSCDDLFHDLLLFKLSTASKIGTIDRKKALTLFCKRVFRPKGAVLTAAKGAGIHNCVKIKKRTKRGVICDGKNGYLSILW